MPKNRVQFQKGMSLSSFMAQYGTEEQCEGAVFAWRWPRGFVCLSCGHPKGYALSRGLVQCAVWRHQCSLTSGTIFASTKLPLRVWFLAMFLLTQAKNGLSALDLSRELERRQQHLADEAQADAGDEGARIEQASRGPDPAR